VRSLSFVYFPASFIRDSTSR